MSHKFTIRQSLLIIAAAVLVGLLANEAGEVAGLSPDAVTAVGVAAAVATFMPLQIVFYRRAHA